MRQDQEQSPAPVSFDETTFADTLRPAAVAVGVPLSDQQIAQCVLYARLLLETNAHTNLTRITEPREMAIKHFADSLTVLSRPHPPAPLSLRRQRGESIAKGITLASSQDALGLPPLPSEGEGGGGVRANSSLCDVGTGAGFPGVVIKIANPHLQLTLLDSLQKRLTFLETVCRELGFDDVQLIHSRAEDAGRNRVLRDAFDVVTARAVAALPILLEWCLPLVRPGGGFVAMKSGNVDDELAGTAEASRLLKARLTENRALTLPSIPGRDKEPPAERRILIYRKMAPTPAQFPRSSSEIKRKSL